MCAGLPYQGGALPLSYRSAVAVYARERQRNQRLFEHCRKACVGAYRPAKSGTVQQHPPECDTLLAHKVPAVFS